MIYLDLKNTFDLCYKSEHGLNLRAVSCGFNEFEREWIHARRWMETYELLFVTRGEVYLQEGERQYALHEGDLLLLSPFQMNFGYRKSDRAVTFYQADFDADRFSALHLDQNPLKTGSLCRMTELFQQLLTVSRAPEYPDFAADLALSQIFVELMAAQAGGEDSSFGLAKKIAEWVRGNIPSVRSVDTVARQFGYHRDTVSRLFKAGYHQSLKSFINQEKLEYAKNLLRTSDYSVRQIARILGYENVNLFIKFFTYHEAISPGVFRKSSLPAEIRT